MNILTKTVVLFIAFVAICSFSQPSLPVQSEKQIGNAIVYDTVRRIISDSVTMAALKSAETFYSTSFSWILSVVTISVGVLTILIGILSLFDRVSKKNIDRDIKREMEEQRTSFEKQRNLLTDEIDKQKKGIKDLIETALKTDRDKNQEKFDVVFRFLSRVYRKLADDKLKKDNFHVYFHIIHIFYKCLINIEKLNEEDLRGLSHAHTSFSEKKTAEHIKLRNEDNIYLFIMYLLMFGKRCMDGKSDAGKECKGTIKSIYNIVFEIKFEGFTLDKELKTKLEDRMRKDGHKEKEITDILNLADKWRDREDDE